MSYNSEIGIVRIDPGPAGNFKYLGSISPVVNRCKLIACNHYQKQYCLFCF